MKNWFTSRLCHFLVLAGVLLLCPTVPALAHNENADVTNGRYQSGGNFTLMSPTGPLSLNDLRGKVVLIFFGYTACPDVCPLTLARINASFSAMKANELDEVRALFISLDPEHDTAERLGKYMSYFHPNIIGLRGETERINIVTGQYGVKYSRKIMPDSALGYSISHPTDILLLDRKGQFASSVPHNTEPGRLVARIRQLLNGSD